MLNTRLLTAAGVAVGVTLALFFLMHKLISDNAGRGNEFEEFPTISFGRIKLPEETKLKDRRIPKKPPPPKDPPPPPKMKLSQINKIVQKMPTPDIPDLDIPLGDGSGPYLGGFGSGDLNQDGDVIPIVRIQPQYPRRALIAKIEGWVKLEFTITEAGTVTDARVLDSKPSRVFDREALRAIYKWRFKPRIADGVATTRRAIQTLEFTLDDS